MDKNKVAVIGAGPAGLTTAFLLSEAGYCVDVFEASSEVGGLCRSIKLWGQTVDLGPHRFFSQDKRVNSLWLKFAGQDYELVDRLTRIFYQGKLFHYPLQSYDVLSKLGAVEAARCLTSYANQYFKRTDYVSELSFEAWVVQRFGRRLYDIFFKTYSEKLWGLPCDMLDADFAAQRIKGFSLSEAIRHAVLAKPRQKHMTLVDQFAYPIGGTGMIYERMAQQIAQLGGVIHRKTGIFRVGLDSITKLWSLLTESGQVFDEYKQVVSTMPLTRLVMGMEDLPIQVKQSVEALSFRNTVLVFLHVDAEDIFPDNWIYVHSQSLDVGRITNFRNWVPSLYGDKKTTIVAMEYWCNNDDEEWDWSDKQHIDKAKRELKQTGLIDNSPVLDGYVEKISKSYPVYKRGYKKHLDIIIQYLKQFDGLTAIGRYGSFKYNNQDHSILMGTMAAENIIHGARNDLWDVNTDYSVYQEKTAISKTGLVDLAT